MKEVLFLVKYGEIALKKRNRGAFVKSLKESIRAKLPGRVVSVHETFHRVFVRCDEADRAAVVDALGRLLGAHARACCRGGRRLDRCVSDLR